MSYKLILINLVFLTFSYSSHAADDAWKKLLLYQRENGSSSLLDKKSKFFLSKNGHKNFGEEYAATLSMFQRPEEFLSQGEGHPQCLYPARFKFMQKVHDLRIPEVYCPALTEWKSRLKGTEVSIIYATQFVSNPASVMGHTFLKFKDPQVEDFLNVSIGYAAEVEMQDSAFEYAFKGLSGQYKGGIFENAFYEKVHEYNNMEQRDIWEYTLNISPEQSDQLLNLLWELKHRGNFSYYFLGENCSYMIMALLEAVVPEKELTEGYGLFVAPYVTLINLDKAKLIKSSSFRPSIRSELIHKYENLNPKEQKKIVQDIDRRKVSEKQSSLYYETLITASLYQKHKNEGNLSKEERLFFNQALTTRSKMEAAAIKKIPLPSSPLRAHHPYFLGLGAGNLSEGKYQFLEVRPGIHGLNDPSSGFLSHSSFSFLEIKYRYFPEVKSFELGRLVFFNLQNTNIIHPVDPEFSWKINLQYQDRDLLVRDQDLYEGEFLIGGAINALGIDVIFLPGLKEQFSPQFKHSHVMWLKNEIQFRLEKEAFVLNLNPSLSKAIINGPDALRLDTALEFRYHFLKHHLQIGPRFQQQWLLDGTKNYFDHYLNVIYDF